MKPAKRIIEKFGGTAALARALGHTNASTVQGWGERGYIPGARHEEVYAAAQSLNIQISAEDFVNVPKGGNGA